MISVLEGLSGFKLITKNQLAGAVQSLRIPGSPLGEPYLGLSKKRGKSLWRDLRGGGCTTKELYLSGDIPSKKTRRITLLLLAISAKLKSRTLRPPIDWRVWADDLSSLVVFYHHVMAGVFIDGFRMMIRRMPPYMRFAHPAISKDTRIVTRQPRELPSKYSRESAAGEIPKDSPSQAGFHDWVLYMICLI